MASWSKRSSVKSTSHTHNANNVRQVSVGVGRSAVPKAMDASESGVGEGTLESL